MTRDQIAQVVAATAPETASAASPTTAPAGSDTSTDPSPPSATPAAAPPATAIDADATAVMPEVADGVAVRWVDVSAPWLGDVGGDSRGTVREAAIAARIAIRYDETKADLVHDEEYEAVLFPLGDHVDVTAVVQVDYDDRDLRTDPPADAVYRLTDAPIGTKSFFTQIERDLRDHLTRSLTLEIPANAGLKLYGRPGESAEEFATRCTAFADERADEEIAGLRDKYETKATRLRDQIEAAEDRVDVLEEEAKSKRNSELFSTAGSFLGGLLGGSKSKGKMVGDMLGDAGTAARRRGSTSASARRVDAAENKVARLLDQLDELEADAEADITAIADKWDALAADVTSLEIGLERSDVRVTQLVLAWVPVE